MIKHTVFEVPIAGLDISVASVTVRIDGSGVTAENFTVMQDEMLDAINDIVISHFTEYHVRRYMRGGRLNSFPLIDGDPVYPANLAEYLAGADPEWNITGVCMRDGAPVKA